MAVGNLSGTEILVIGLIALIVLGPDKLPEALRKLGGFMRDVKRVSSGFQSEIRSALNEPLKPESPASPSPGTPASSTPTSSIEPAVGSEAPAGGSAPPAAEPQPTENTEGSG